MTTKTAAARTGTEQACANTDRELWREVDGDYYADSIHVTSGGGIGINHAGHVYVATLAKWHHAMQYAATVDEIAAERDSLRAIADVHTNICEGEEREVALGKLLNERDTLLAQNAELESERDKLRAQMAEIVYADGQRIAELVAALRETQTDVSDARTLAKRLLEDRHHCVTGTEAERIAYLLQYVDRCQRVARAALAKVSP